MTSRKVVLALDESEHSRAAVDAVFETRCCILSDEVHLVAVMPPISDAAVWPTMGPIGSPAVITTIQENQRAQKRIEEREARELLCSVSEWLMEDYKVPASHIHVHVLPATGGASGVSDAILTLVKSLNADMLVSGSRGMGGVKSSFMSLVGLGSVGDALLKETQCPVLIARQDPAKKKCKLAGAAPAAPAVPSEPLGTEAAGTALTGPPPHAGKHVCVAFDGSPASDAALRWAIGNLLQPQDKLHITSVAVSPSPFPVAYDPGAGLMLARQLQEQLDEEIATTKLIAQKAVAAAEAQGVLKTNIISTVLTDSATSAALLGYISNTGVSVVVCGSRGMGTFKRAFEHFVGLGSVSMQLAHSVHGVVAVVRAPSPPSQP